MWNMERIHLTASEEMSFENVDGRTPDTCIYYNTVLIVHRIVLFWEPDRCFQDGGQENRREVGTYFITISSVY